MFSAVKVILPFLLFPPLPSPGGFNAVIHRIADYMHQCLGNILHHTFIRLPDPHSEESVPLPFPDPCKISLNMRRSLGTILFTGTRRISITVLSHLTDQPVDLMCGPLFDILQAMLLQLRIQRKHYEASAPLTDSAGGPDDRNVH